MNYILTLILAVSIILLPKTSDAATKLQLLLPGESATPGTAPGKTGSPINQTAGSSFTVTVNAVDDNWYVDTADGSTVSVTTSDLYDTEPASGYLVNGTTTSTLTLVTAGTTTVTAGDIDGEPPLLTADTTSVYVLPTPANKPRHLLVLVPGETAEPGSATGKTGTPVVQTAGVRFPVSVYVVDEFNNIAPEAQPSITLTSSDPNDDTNVGLPEYAWDPMIQPLLTGTTVFNVPLVTANTTHIFTARDDDGEVPFYGTANSESVYINAGTPSRFHVLVPTETAKPNTALGKTQGAATPKYAGQSFYVTINCTDVLWNVRTGFSLDARIQTTDPYVAVSTPNLPNGTAEILMILYNAEMTGLEGYATHYIIATTTGGPLPYGTESVTISTGVSSAITVYPNDATQFQVLVPNEKPVPGKSPYDGTGGKQYSVSVQTAGVQFPVTVRVVDNYYNICTTATVGLVTVTTTEPDYLSAEKYSRSQGLMLGQNIWGDVRIYCARVSSVVASGSKPTSYSSPITVVPNVPLQLQALASGEASQPGRKSTRGRNPNMYPTAQVAGVSFNVTANTCDEYFNRVATTPVVRIWTNDLYDIEPGTRTLTGGTTTFTVRMVTRKNSIVYATTDYCPGFITDYTGEIFVSTNVPYAIQILVPGETPVEGKWRGAPGENTQPGKTEDSQPMTQAAGTAFNVTVRCVDEFFNKTDENPQVTITSDGSEGDPYDAPSEKTKQLVDGQYVFTGAEAWTFVTRNDASGTGWRIRLSGFNWLEGEPVPPYFGPTAVLAASSPTPRIPVSPGASNRLQVLLPGEEADWGNSAGAGKKGTALTQTAGVSFPVISYACDGYWNRARINTDGGNETSATEMSSDNHYYSIVPSQQYLVYDSTVVFTATLYTAVTTQFTIVDLETPILTTGRSTIITVKSSAPISMQVLLPGESLRPGKPPYYPDLTGGRIGGIQTQIAGTTFYATVQAVDSYWNRIDGSAIASANDISWVRLDTQDPYDVHPATAQLSAGAGAYLTKFVTAGTWTITSVDIDGTTGSDYTPPVALAVGISSPVYAQSGPPDRLLILLPGETPVQGLQPLGKTGTPAQQTAGKTFNITVNLCDSNWNKVPQDGTTVSLGSTDIYWSTPTAKTMSKGSVDFTLGGGGMNGSGIITASTHYITAGGDIYSGISSTFTVRPDVASRLLAVLPGEYQVNGKIGSPPNAAFAPYGRGGTPVQQTAGVRWTATVYSADAYYNRVSTVQTITVTLSDIYGQLSNNVINVDNLAVEPSTTVFMTGGVATIATARVRSAGNQTITASDNDGVSPSLDSHTSSAVSVKSATAAKLQTLVPGEVAVQGSPTGKTGAPYSQVVGTTFTITVNSVDAYWNKVSSTPMVNVATSDPNDTEPANNGLIDGSIVFDICFASSGTWTATANDVAAVLLSDISSEIKVNSLPPAQITTLEAYQNSTADTIKLLWITPGSDGMNNTLAEGSEYSIQYSTLDPAGVVWSTGSAQVVISTNSVAPGLKVSVTAQLAMNEIYYFRIWTKDEEGNWSVQSTTAAAFNSPYTFETVDSEGQVGFYTSIAVDGSGNPHISYSYWGTDYDLKYAKWTGSSWDIQTVDSAGLVNVGAFTSIALDTNNYPHISYLDSTDFNLKYAKWTGSSWDIQTVDSSVAVDNNSSLTLDGSGNPHVSYYDKTNGDLKYAKWTGTSWDIQTVDSTNNVGGFSSLAIDGSGNPHISYRDYTNLDLKYAKWTGSSWDIRIVDSEDDVGSWTSIAIDSLENPHISYNDYTNFDLKYAKWAGTSWSTWTVDSEGKVGWYATSIALDGSGNPHISYRSYPECALRYARWTGSSWSAQIVDSEGDLGRYSSLCLDDSGNVHISYFVFTSSDLKYAKWDGAGFEPLPKTPSNFGPSSVYISSITWSWTDNASNELGFRMYSSSPGTSGFVLVADTNTIGTVGGTGGTGNWTQKNLTPNTSYHNYVAAVNEGGVVTSSSAIKFTLANPPAETQVIAVSSESVSIQWNANSNPSDTRWGILRSTNNFATSTATLTDFGSNYTSTSFTDSGLQPDASYYYKVCAYNKDGIASDFILAMTTLTALSVPSTPKGLYGIAVASVSIKWEWDISSGSTYYRVYDDASALLVNLESPGTPTWIEVNLLHNSQHSRYVRAGNEAGLSSASNTASKYTLTIPPAGLSISSAGAHTVELSWQTNNSTRFRIDTSTAGDWTALKTLDWSASITTPPYTITELQPSTTYCFAVFGYNGDQIQTLTSATVSGVTSDLSQTLVVISPGEDKTATRTNTVGGVTLEIKVELLAGAVTKQAYLEISVDPLNSPLLVNKNKIIEANNKLALSPDAKKNVVDDTLTEFVLRDYDTGNQNTANFNNTVTLTLSYPDADNDGFIDGTDPKIPEDALKIHILNEVTNEWELAGDGGMVDKSNNNVRVEVQHFSVYALISIKTAATDLTAVKAYPNPYKPGATGADARFDRASGIRFDNLTNKVNIRVFNIAGELVFEKDAENTVGYLDWQAVNNNNEKIASGVYIYYITNPDDTSHKAKGRVAIIR